MNKIINSYINANTIVKELQPNNPVVNNDILDDDEFDLFLKELFEFDEK